jgi:hypothetical protein
MIIDQVWRKNKENVEDFFQLIIMPVRGRKIIRKVCREEKKIKYDFIQALPERIYNPITAMGFSAMFTFQLDNTKR